METRSFRIKASSDNLEISGLVALPESESPKGILQIAHGMCEHKERYISLMGYIASKGYVCVIHDHRGHGESVLSSDDLGYMYKGGWRAMVEDLKLVTMYIREMYPGLPLCLLGHSMGSMVVRSFVKRYDSMIDSLIVCGCPTDNPLKGAGKALAGLFCLIRGDHYRPQLLQNMSFGAFNKPFEADGPNAWVCSDKTVLKAYNEDPLCQFIFTANGFRNLMGLMGDCYSSKGWALKNPSMPVHIISGENDPCKSSIKAFGKAVDLMRKVGYSDVDSKLYGGMRHEILNETDKAVVWYDVLSVVQALQSSR